MSKEETAKALLSSIYKGDVREIEERLGFGDSISWRELIRYEFDILSMDMFKDETLILKLVEYEMRTISAFHLAAMVGNNDILVNLLDKDIPVDMPLSSGTTALHIASFAGRADTIKVLIDVYKAELGKRDRYGWSALHYACTEGQLNAAKVLVEAGLDVKIRDQDGTSAAFRAQINGHEDLVQYLCQHGDEDELLNVEEEEEDLSDSGEPQYSAVQKRSMSISEAHFTPDSPDYGVLAFNNEPLYAKPNKNKGGMPPTLQAKPADSSQFHPSSKIKRDRAMSLPARSKNKKMGRNTIRRILRNELYRVFDEDEYMSPRELKNSQPQDDTKIKIGDSEMGVNTMKGIMREELDKFRKEVLKDAAKNQRNVNIIDDHNANNRNYSDSDSDADDYASLANLPRAPGIPSNQEPLMAIKPGPPLPPRNPNQLLNALDESDDNENSLSMTLATRESSNAALNESMKKLAPQLGGNWKKLAHALPLEQDQTKLSERISAIEKVHPGSPEKQAAMALGEWRINQGKNADIDSLIIALRKAALHDIIPVVEKVTQEFTA